MSNQTVIRRAKHDKEHPFVMVSRAMIRDKSISFKAKGLLTYLLSLSDNWQVHPRQIASEMEIGVEQIYSGIKELIEAGYCRRIQEKDNTGRFSVQIYEFSEEKIFQSEEKPYTEKPKTVQNTSEGHSPHRGFPDTEKPNTKNTINKKEHIKKREKEKKSQEVKIKHGEIVDLTEKQYQTLCDDFGKPPVDDKIEEMNDWIPNNRDFNDYYLALRRWLRKDRKKLLNDHYSKPLDDREVYDEELKNDNDKGKK